MDMEKATVNYYIVQFTNDIHVMFVVSMISKYTWDKKNRWKKRSHVGTGTWAKPKKGVYIGWWWTSLAIQLSLEIQNDAYIRHVLCVMVYLEVMLVSTRVTVQHLLKLIFFANRIRN